MACAMTWSSVSTCARAAISGTTPPNAACASNWLDTTLDRMRPLPSSWRSTTAAAVSSQVVSMPRTSMCTVNQDPAVLRRSRGVPPPPRPASQMTPCRPILPGSRVVLKGGVASSWPMAQSAALFRIGTRGSALALAQARMVQARLAATLGVEAEALALVVIRTTGDAIADRPLAEQGGKGLFTKEIDEALLDGRIDLAVHSAKDVPTFLPRGLVLAACLEREDPRDAFVSRIAASLGDLPYGARLGTSSLRRQAIARKTRPDLRELDEGAADATILALAGLKRLDMEVRATRVMSVAEFLPAVAQGAIAIAAREHDARVREALARIDHVETSTTIACERAFLAALDGSCRTPIAGHATLSGGALHIRGMIIKPDGSAAHEIARSGSRSEATMIGADAGRSLRQQAGRGFFD